MEFLKKKVEGWILIWGFALAGAAFVGWILSTLLPDKISLSSGAAASTIAILLCMYVGTTLQIWMARYPSELDRPRVLLFKKEEVDLFLFSPAEWLSYRYLYTLFAADTDGFERLLGIAEVLNVQDDKRVQIVVTDRASGAESVWSSLDGGSTDYFRKITIKPGALKNG